MCYVSPVIGIAAKIRISLLVLKMQGYVLLPFCCFYLFFLFANSTKYRIANQEDEKDIN